MKTTTTYRLGCAIALLALACDDSGGGGLGAATDFQLPDGAVDAGSLDGAAVPDAGSDDAASPDAAATDMAVDPDAAPDPDVAVVEPDAEPPPPPDPCEPLPPIPDDAISLSPENIGNLRNMVRDAAPGATFVFEPGEYPLDGEFIRVDVAGVTLRGRTGNRDDVVLDGEYASTQVITVAADDVTIADLTIRRAFNHAVHVTGGVDDHTDRTRLVNLAVIDPGQQGIKINGNVEHTFWANDGLIACSHIELTDEGRPNIRDNCYTGGIDAHGARGWTVARNEIRGFWCVAGLSEHGVHFWRGSRDTLVERNLLVDNARGIGLGLGFSAGDNSRTYDDPPECAEGSFGHYEATIRNNFVAAGDVRAYASVRGVDVGIGLEAVCGVRVVHNTVAFTMDPSSSAIEWRFEHTTDVLLANNLSTHRLIARDEASARALTNAERVDPAVFTDVATGDLHLLAGAEVPAAGRLAVGVADDDFDGDPRTDPRDVGADERE